MTLRLQALHITLLVELVSTLIQFAVSSSRTLSTFLVELLSLLKVLLDLVVTVSKKLNHLHFGSKMKSILVLLH